MSYETIRARTVKFGPKIPANLRRRKLPPSPRWHLDEMVCKIGGERVYLWRAVDDEGEVLDLVVQKSRDTRAALKLLKQLLGSQPVEPERIVTDGLASYGSALRVVGREGVTGQVACAKTTAQQVASANPKAQAKDAWVQIGGFSAAVSDDACWDLQRVRFTASNDQPANAPGLSGTGGLCLGEGCRLSGSPRPAREFGLRT